MIDNLAQTLPEYRRSALHREMELLDSTIERLYLLPQDLALAREPDTQGLGGTSISSAPGANADREAEISLPQR
jgi:hypothetical protein